MGPKFNKSAYGKPPPRSSRLPEDVVEASASFASGVKNHTKEQQIPLHEKSSVENTASSQNDAGADASLKKGTSTPEARVTPAAAESQQPAAETCLVDKTNIPSAPDHTDKQPSLPVRETSPTSVSAQADDTKFLSPPTKDKASGSLLPIQDYPVLEVPSRESVTSAKSLKQNRSLETQADSSRNSKSNSVRPNTNVRVMHKMNDSNQAVARSDRLRLLQDASLRQITRKSAARKSRDTNTTASIRDLDLARAPVDVKDPESSKRTWTQDSPVYDDGYQKEKGAPFAMHKDASVVPQLPSTRNSNSQIAAPIQPAATSMRRSKWPSKDEMKAEKAETDSNQWGSAAPSDATRSSNASDDSLGKLLRNRPPAAVEPLHDWEGNLMPPPADWAERPRFNNNNPDFVVQFRQYIRNLQARFSNGVPIKPVPATVLQSKQNHPDGIGMIRRTKTIDHDNAEQHGYTDPAEVLFALQYYQPIQESDYEVSCKLDPDDEANTHFDWNETTNSLVTNWNNHIANSRGEPIATEPASAKHTPVSNAAKSSKAKLSPIEDTFPAAEEEEVGEEGTPLAQPKLNIYLRPATRADLSELTRLYNWYITNGSQPAELREVDESEMQSRMDFCASSKLPFIVAACMSQKGARPIPYVDDEELSRRRQLPVTHKQHITLTRIENLAGFCCANDFTQPDFVEHIAADIEIYVDAQYRRMGVGKSLMDKMLQICDLSHSLTMNVPFHCHTEVRHMYGPGGVRNIHKMSILLRKWHSPRAATIDVQGRRKPKKLAFAKTRENDYAQWLRRWFESFGFREEGYLTKMGAKHGRYIDLVYFGRETSWEPSEGKVPSPAPEFLDATTADDDDY